jgi:hypothetical protein
MLGWITMRPANYILRILVAVACCGSCAHAILAQTQMPTPAAQPPASCKSMRYSQEQVTALQPLDLAELHGTAVDRNNVVLENVCIGIFSEDTHKILRYARTDNNGGFSIDTKGLPDGTYRLVGKFVGFCPANAIIHLDARSNQKEPLVLKMNMPGSKTCSTVEIEKK